MKAFVKVMQDIGLLVSRVVFGAVMIGHGWARWSGEGIPAQVDRLVQLGVPQPELFAWGATVLELLGGVLMVFGILTPLVAAAFLAQFVMLTAYTWSHGPYLATDGYEYSLILAAFALLFVVFGSGRAGVDNLFRRPRGESGPSVDDNAPA